MIRVPSFDNPQELREAVTPLVINHHGHQSSHLDATVELIVDHLMSPQISAQAKKIRSARLFDQQVTQVIRQLDARIDDLLKIAKGVAKRKYQGHSAQYIEDLVQHVHRKLLRPEGHAHLFDATKGRGYAAKTFGWWMSDELMEMNRFQNLGRKVKLKRSENREGENQDGEGQASPKSKPKKDFARLVYATGKGSEREQRDWIENLPDTEDLSTKLEAEELSKTRFEMLIPEVLKLSGAERSALISREWRSLSEVAPETELAEHVNSPLPLEERIALLNSIEHDQKRMVKVKFPELINEDAEYRARLATLNRASTRGLNKLQHVMRERG